jgi:hypothetical protein
MAVLLNGRHDLLIRGTEGSAILVEQCQIRLGWALGSKPFTEFVHLGLRHGDEYHMNSQPFIPREWKT